MSHQELNKVELLTEQICYEMPPYQRPYSWKKEHVQQFLEDVWEAYINEDKEYFIGSLITIEKEKNMLYEIVDGQQRLTTLNLIFSRLKAHTTNEAAKEELGKRILQKNPLNDDDEGSPRLLIRKKDQYFFRSHVLDGLPISIKEKESLEAPQKRIIENIGVIDEFCKDKTEKELKLFANYILQMVYVVFVNTDSWKSAYRLFNVLNARGLSLSNSDLIKNTLFSLLGSQVHKSSELEERWIELEEEVGVERLDSFFSHHRTSITASKPRYSLHEEFETIIRKTPENPFTFLNIVINSAKNYIKILDSDFENPTSLCSLKALHRVEYDEWIPPLLTFLNHPVDDFPESEFINLLEKITMQNWVRRLGRTARLTVYFQLISAIIENRNANDIRDIFRKNASNKEFLELLGGDIYGKPFDSAVLLRLEEASQDESVIKSYNGRLTIEHIMPQALKDEYWKSRFSEDQHKLWLHRLGNLAMLCGSKNYKAQYYDFNRKKKIYNDRGKKVSFDLTKEVCLVPEWNEDAIKKRHERIMKLAEETWIIN